MMKLFTCNGVISFNKSCLLFFLNVCLAGPNTNTSEQLRSESSSSSLDRTIHVLHYIDILIASLSDPLKFVGSKTWAN